MSEGEQAAMPFPILIGDIGGTNGRFSLLVDLNNEPVQLPDVRTADFENFEQALEQSILPNCPVPPRSAILALAGPIDGDEVDLTNCPWVVRPRNMIADLGFADVLLVNDFEAQALAAATLGEADLASVGQADGLEDATRVVLGPGTGLGVAGLIFAQGKWVPVPGEGGHVDVGPRTARDYKLFPHFEPIDGRISAEQLLCGRGLVNIYRGICAADGVDPVLLSGNVDPVKDAPAIVSAAGLAGDNPQAQEALTLFVTYLGRVAGDLALIFMARGGVFLAGGISQKIISVLQQPEFRAAFEDKAPHSALLRQIPSFVVIHPYAALAGLAEYARAPQRFGISTKGRRWQA